MNLSLCTLTWDLNYRGELDFLDQARGQQKARGLQIVDGWTYFIHEWTQAIPEVFDVSIPTSGAEFDRLSDIALEYGKPSQSAQHIRRTHQEPDHYDAS